MKEVIITAILFALLIVLFGLVGRVDYEQALEEEKTKEILNDENLTQEEE